MSQQLSSHKNTVDTPIDSEDYEKFRASHLPQIEHASFHVDRNQSATSISDKVSKSINFQEQVYGNIPMRESEDVFGNTQTTWPISTADFNMQTGDDLPLLKSDQKCDKKPVKHTKDTTGVFAHSTPNPVIKTH